MFYLILFEFNIFGCYLSEACSLQQRERKGTHPGGSRDGGKVGGAEEGEAAVRIHYVRKDYFQ